MWAVVAILAALRQRDDGKGAQLVDTSLYETAVNWLPYQIAGYLGSGQVPRAMGTALGIISPYQAFEARDRWVMLAAGNDRQFAALCDVLGVPEVARDPRFLTNPDRVANRDALSEIIAARFRDDDAASWLDRLAEAGVPAAPVQDVAEVVADAQTDALGLLQPLPNQAVPDLRLVALPLTVDGERVPHRAPPPTLGEHTIEILREAGYADAEIDRLVGGGVITTR
jgi:crotonobetainyl-CoA:carnitine CoA-transferase CaiB-like acyl-CoA transferase